jgi:hypothetical protein
MKEVNKLLYVAERDIDLLLLEELNVNPAFSSWLFRHTNREPVEAPFCNGAWHSVTHPQLGESDLVVMYENGFAILIENKVDAPAQPDQATRYKKRGERGQLEGSWKSFVTCIVAPERYLKGNSEAQNYDVCVSYEEIRDLFEREKSQRSRFRAYILGEAIAQNRRGYSPVADDDVTQFWLSYWQIANEQFPALELPRPGIKPANADWPDFRPKELGKELNIVHKMAQGCVDLQVRGAAERLDEIRSLLNDPSLEVVAAGKSGAVRIVVAPVDRFGSFDAQRGDIIRALEAADKLLQIAKGIRNSK